MLHQIEENKNVQLTDQLEQSFNPGNHRIRYVEEVENENLSETIPLAVQTNAGRNVVNEQNPQFTSSFGNLLSNGNGMHEYPSPNSRYTGDPVTPPLPRRNNRS